MVGGSLPYDGSKILYVCNRKLSAERDVQAGATVTEADEAGNRLVLTVDKVTIAFTYTSTKGFDRSPTCSTTTRTRRARTWP